MVRVPDRPIATHTHEARRQVTSARPLELHLPYAWSSCVAQGSHNYLRNTTDLSSLGACFSPLEAMFGKDQDNSLSDLIQAALMLRYNGHNVG